MRVLHIDFETASAADLPTVGVHKYAEHWTTHVYCMAYAFDKEPPRVWFMWEPFPQEVIEHVAAGGIVVAHNAAFERTLWNVVLRRPNVVRGFPAIEAPELKIEQMVCTMARASTISLPAGLDYVAEVMGFQVRKDLEGAKIMKTFMNPESVTFFEDGHAEYVWRNDEAGFRRVGEYCKTDVEVEVRADAALMQHTPRERRVWELDQKINDRGVALDIRLIKEATKVVEAAKARLHTRMNDITGGDVKKCSEVKKLVAWINSKGIDCTSVAKGQQEELILQADIVDKTVREAIELRQQSGKGSPTSKYQTMLDCACADGKARGQLFYHGANTGRWAGRLIQFQNLPGMDEDRDGANVRSVVEILLCDSLNVDEKVDALGLVTGAVLPSLSRALRWMLIASPGCRFVGGDLSNIEGCVAAWITDEDWKIEAYREFQAGRGADLYKLAYSRGFGADVASITKLQRQIGKVIELALGYQGSIGAFISMARIYGVKPGDMVEPIRNATRPEVWEAARLRMRRPGTRTYGLTEDEWTAARVAVDNYRATNAKITASWWELQDAAILAVAEPGKPVECLNGRIAYVVARNVLWCRLPSGRTLAYHRPRLQVNTAYQMTDAEGNTAYVDEADVPRCLGSGFTFVLDEEGEKVTRQKRQVLFEHYDSMKKRWVADALYGGLQFENCLGADTEVLTSEGWVRLGDVKLYHAVWDGAAWVGHGGLVYQGRQDVIKFAGVTITPDHKISTGVGWSTAGAITPGEAAEAFQRHYRLPAPHACGGVALGFQSRAPRDVALQVRLRELQRPYFARLKEWLDVFMRMRDVGDEGRELRTGEDTRHVAPSGLRGLELHETAVLQSQKQSLQELRSAWHRSVLALVERVRGVLGRYGANILAWARDRSPRQRWQLHARELSVGKLYSSSEKPEGQSVYIHSRRSHDSIGGLQPDRDTTHNRSLPNEPELAGRASIGPTRLHQPHRQDVYDILNAGPNHRFTVRGTDKRPFVVSNCVQATARDVMIEGMFAAEEKGYPIVLTVHDELLCDVPVGHGSAAELQSIMSTVPSWCQGLPLAAKTWEDVRYAK